MCLLYIVVDGCRCVDARLVKNPKIQNTKTFFSVLVFFVVVVDDDDENDDESSYRGMREHNADVCVLLPHAVYANVFVCVCFNREIKSTIKAIRTIRYVYRMHRVYMQKSRTHTRIRIYDFVIRGKKKNILSALSLVGLSQRKNAAYDVTYACECALMSLYVVTLRMFVTSKHTTYIHFNAHMISVLMCVCACASEVRIHKQTL